MAYLNPQGPMAQGHYFQGHPRQYLKTRTLSKHSNPQNSTAIFHDISHKYVEWNLYKATTELFSITKQVLFHNRKNHHDFLKTAK